MRQIKPEDLTSADHGVKHLLKALSAWEESAELRTFELFEKALYKTIQKSDESTQSFVNRLDVAFEEVGAKTTLKTVVAFVLLKQSSLNHEDKKKILTMTGGNFDKDSIANAMRSLSTSVLSGSGMEKKKVYPTNYVDDGQDIENEQHFADQNALAMQAEEEDLSQETLEQMALAGDADAMTVQAFERELTNLFQEVPDLHSALLSYQEARGRITDRKRNRGFWPVRSPSGGKSGKGLNAAGSKGFRKGQSKGKDELLARIARTHCKRCGELGHWKAECPLKSQAKESQANVASAQEALDPDLSDQVLFEAIASDPEVGFRRNETDKTEASQKEFSACSINQPLRQELSAEVNFSEAIIDKTKAFFLQRKPCAFSVGRTSTPSKQSRPAGTPERRRINDPGQASGFETNGMAILDTGASRSVIGELHLPKLMSQLPEPVRSRVKEKASRIAFRFGNNQIEYSYKQVHIPIDQGKIRMWLIVEVVPRGTPFLLSIQTMKRLGTVIDLQSNSCFLRSLNKAVQLFEGRTGLLMIRIQDLCQSSECQSIFGASSDSKANPQIFEQDADTGRNAANGEEYGRECGAFTPDSAHDSFESSGHSSLESGSSNGTSHYDEPAHERGSVSEGENRGAGRNDEESSTVAKSPRRGIHTADRERSGSVGPGGPSLSTTPSSKGIANDSRCVNDANDIPTKSRTTDGSRERKLPCPSDKESGGWNGHHAGEDRPRDTTTWEPIKWSRANGQSAQPKPRLDNHGNGAVGIEACDLGKETPWENIPGSLRTRQPVCELVFKPHQFIGRSDRRFRSLLPNTATDGATAAPKPGVDLGKEGNWETLISDSQIIVETAFEAKLIQAAKSAEVGKAFGKPIDLLEVYAQPNSRLAEEVRKQGGRSERFTKEHGDLATFQGQLQLIRMIIRLRPKHIWVAPECFPWCAWNRFNAGRSTHLFEKIQRNRELSKQHLELCTLICKIQVQQQRHFTAENPGTSDIWKQPELEPLLALTKTVQLDQCRFGLIHPEDDRPLKKHTRLQTTSDQIVKDLDGRYCKQNHEHAQIAGSCKHLGERMALSRYAAFYPRVFARAARSILQEVQPARIPVVFEEDWENLFPVDEEHPPAKRARFEPPRESKRKEASEDSARKVLADETWIEAFDWFQKNLPKSGSIEVSTETWPGNFIVEQCEFQVRRILAGKGMDRYLIGETTHEIRRTICQCRKT